MEAFKGERITMRTKLHNDELEAYLEVTIFMGATSAYSISYVDYCELRDYINSNIMSEAA